MPKGDVENLNPWVVILYFNRGGNCLARGSRFDRSSFFFRRHEIRIVKRLNQRIACALLLQEIFLWLGQWVKQSSLGHFTLNRSLRFMHSDQERQFTETDRLGV